MDCPETHAFYFLLGGLPCDTENSVGSTASYKCYLQYLSFWYERLMLFFTAPEHDDDAARLDKSMLVEVSNNFSVLKSEFSRSVQRARE